MPDKQYIQAQGTVDSTGKCVITFPSPPTGYTWTGSITLINAPSGSAWAILNTSTQVDIMQAGFTAANIQASEHEQISLQATAGLIVGTSVNAVWVIQAERSSQAALILPAHDSINPLASYARQILNSGPISFSTTFIGLPIQPSDRSIIIMIEGSSTCFIASCTGQSTGVDYFQSTKPLAAVTSLNQLGTVLTGPYIIPVPGAIENAVNVAVSGPTSGTSTVVAYATPDIYPGLNFNEPLNVTQFDPGATTVPYTVTTVNAATGATTALLAAPAANHFWEVSFCSVWQSSAATAIQQVGLRGHTSNNFFLVLPLHTTAPLVGHVESSAKFLLNEGIDLVNQGTGATASGSVIARSVPTTFSGAT